MKYLSIIALLGLVACGADGAPERPAERLTAKPGVSLSGEASIGVTNQ